MRNLKIHDLARRTDIEERIYGAKGDKGNGVFSVPSELDQLPLNIIASDGNGWDHVSVSRNDRLPRYEEMRQVVRLFFKDTETVMELHVPKKEHINRSEHVLHLWRPQNVDIPQPPHYMV